MNHIKYGWNCLLLVFMSLVFVLPFSACAQTQSVQIVECTQNTEVKLREWDSKTYSQLTTGDFVTVIADSGLSGQIVLLRWNGDKTKFIAEVFERENKNSLYPSWLSVDGQPHKTITQQPDGDFHITRKVQEGIEVERFILFAGKHDGNCLN